jgi:hypothetical protein
MPARQISARKDLSLIVLVTFFLGLIVFTSWAFLTTRPQKVSLARVADVINDQTANPIPNLVNQEFKVVFGYGNKDYPDMQDIESKLTVSDPSIRIIDQKMFDRYLVDKENEFDCSLYEDVKSYAINPELVNNNSLNYNLASSTENFENSINTIPAGTQGCLEVTFKLAEKLDPASTFEISFDPNYSNAEIFNELENRPAKEIIVLSVEGAESLESEIDQEDSSQEAESEEEKEGREPRSWVFFDTKLD